VNTKKMDLESLDELISLCEDKMIGPFRKKKEDEPEGPAEPEKEEGPDMSDMDMDDLIEAYESAKSQKEG
jgi:hypothetical protein